MLSCSDAADLVVQGKGTFEELMVCSREITASTAQLVAASKVGARLLPFPCFRVMLGHHVVTPNPGAGLLARQGVTPSSLLSGEGRQRQRQPLQAPASLPGRHPGHSQRGGLHQGWEVSSGGER